MVCRISPDGTAGCHAALKNQQINREHPGSVGIPVKVIGIPG